MTPERFLDTLFGPFEDGLLTLFSIGPDGDRRTDWFEVDQLDDMAAAAKAMPERDVWFGLATRRERLDEGRRGGAAECVAIGALWADIDIAGPNHKDSTGLPKSCVEAMELIGRFRLEPSIVVNSGGGLHAYWLLQEPLEAEAALVLLERWAETWAQIASKMKLRVDNVFDLPRVLRLPGTVNHKNHDGTVVTVVTERHHRYGLDDLMESTVDPPVRQHRSQRTGAPILGVRPGDHFNQRHTGGYVLGLAGWRLERTDRAGNESWLHPWGPTSDCSATVYAEDGHTTIWSDTVPKHAPVEIRTPYDPFGLYARLLHDGDTVAAARQLALDGYGERPAVTLVTMPNGKFQPKRKIYTSSRHLDDLANEVVDGLIELNQPPRLFTHGDIVSKFGRGELRPVDRVELLHVVESSLTPLKRTKDGDVPARVDQVALDLVLRRLQHDLPTIEGIARSPFLRFDGTIAVEVGYDAPSRMYLASTMPVAVPDEPNAEDVRLAVGVIDEMIADFPLATAADRAHVFGLLLTLVTRHLVPLSPLFAFDGNGPGVGKNLLSECCVYVATGEWAQTDPLSLDAEEQRKHITSIMAAGRNVALFDEAHIVSGTSLARLITSTTWGDRLLGYSRQVSYPNRMVTIALGNNIEVQGDMPRRTVVIRLSSSLSRPELRADFRHDNLRAWVAQNRSAVLEAVLTILRAWVVAGRPAGTTKLGSFDAWAEMVGGALEHAGVEGFLSNADEMRRRAAVDDSDMADHLAELRGYFGDEGFTVTEVADLLHMKRIETWPPKVGHSFDRIGSQLGYAYRRVSNRWFDDLMLVADGLAHGGVKKWHVVSRTDGVSPPSPPDTTNPLVGGGDGGDGGDALSYARKTQEDTHIASDPRKPSPPSPPSPPVETVGHDGWNDA